eukprot:Awhi_evm1s13928
MTILTLLYALFLGINRCYGDIAIKFYCEDGYQVNVKRQCVRNYCSSEGHIITLQLNPATNQYDKPICFARKSYNLQTTVKRGHSCAYGSLDYQDPVSKTEYCIGHCYPETHRTDMSNGRPVCQLKSGVAPIIEPLQDVKPLKCRGVGTLVSVDLRDNSIICNY